MNTRELLMNFLFGGTTILFLAMSISALVHLRWARRLPQLRDLPALPQAEPVKCSVVIAAQNEESRIEATIRYLLSQTEVELEIIVVDDRSTDGTTKILQRLAGEVIQHSRLDGGHTRGDVVPDDGLARSFAGRIVHHLPDHQEAAVFKNGQDENNANGQHERGLDGRGRAPTLFQ